MKQEFAPRSENDGEVILVVEDDAALLTLIEKSLAKQGFRTVGVADGGSALRWLEANAPRLMLLDYSLPDMRGEELLEQLEARGRQRLDSGMVPQRQWRRRALDQARRCGAGRLLEEPGPRWLDFGARSGLRA